MKLRNKFHFKIHISKKAFYIFSFIFIIFVFFLTGFFLYKFVYKSIIYSEEIINKKNIVAPVSFKKEDFEAIIQKIQDKKNATDSKKILEINNFFLENRVSTTTHSLIQKNEEKMPTPPSTNAIIGQ